MVLFSIVACESDNKHESDEAKVTYTCSMHPQVVSGKPGKCPICGMELVVFDRNNQDPTLTLSQSQISLANITSMPVGDTLMQGAYRRINGRITVDPSRTVYVSSKFAGRIDRMYVKEKGVRVFKGQPLFAIYSEDLLALLKEYMVANAQVKAFPKDARFSEIEAAAKNKLKLYGLTDNYITKLSEKTGPDSHITINAENDGIVADVFVQEGGYVSLGADVMRIENYNRLWAEAEVNSQFVSSIKIGQRVKVAVTGYEDLLDATVSFITPDLESNTQIQIVRVEIGNVDNRLQPGAQAVLQFPVGADVGSLSVPADAVIRDGRGAHVWIDIGKGKFSPRMVETGVENADEVEITSGLASGEHVVVSGAYLLYSEYILKKGANPMSSHNH